MLNRFVKALIACALSTLWVSFGNAPLRAQSPAAVKALVQPVVKLARSEPKIVSPQDESARLAAQVKIYRDAYGVPHVDGKSDESVVFGFAYAQAEDNFWQIEDNYILGLGRYSEVHGPQGLNSDLLNRSFEITQRSKASYARLEPEIQSLCQAFVAGLNYYLATHPEVKPRLITRFEPWHVLAFGRHMTLEICFRYTGLSNNYLPRSYDLIWPATGSNGWAIAPGKTRSGSAMLMVNPHLPWFGFSQMYEGHLRSGEGWNFTGATTFGNPLLSLGHNEHLGWTFTTNEPDVADVWRVTFDDTTQPLNYRFGKGYCRATEWHDTIKVKAGSGFTERLVTLRKTHYGPIVAREDDQHFLAARLSGLGESVMLRQTSRLMRASNLSEFRSALAMQQFPIMNIVYADRQGNVLFLYNGLIPKRDPQFDWTRPLDGGDPRTAWRGMFKLEELPQVLNPSSQYVQNCNSSPFTTCDVGSPQLKDFPSYMAQDGGDDKRRAKRSRQLLRQMDDVTFEEVEDAAFDTTVYWAQQELPKYRRRLEQLKTREPLLASQVEPLLRHLLAWNCRITADCTAATLCEAWYEELYGTDYPAEQLLPRYVKNPDLEFQALFDAALKLTAIYGKWMVPWGEVFRTQRSSNLVDLLELPFDDKLASLPSCGAPGPMGVIFTQYYSPSVHVPFFKSLTRRYGLIGAAYLAVYEFGDRIRGASAVNFGQCGNPASANYCDQAKLLSQHKLKPELFYWDEVFSAARESYHPGQRAARRELN